MGALDINLTTRKLALLEQRQWLPLFTYSEFYVSDFFVCGLTGVCSVELKAGENEVSAKLRV